MAKPIPEGLRSITPSMSVDGCAEAMEFYKRAFGATEIMRAPDPSGKKVWHAAMKIGDSQFFINDTFPEMGAGPTKASLWIYSAEVDALWNRAVEAGVTVRMPIADMFWGDRVGSVTDRWGNNWTLAKHIKDLTPAEMQTAQDAAVKAMKAGK